MLLCVARAIQRDYRIFCMRLAPLAAENDEPLRRIVSRMQRSSQPRNLRPSPDRLDGCLDLELPERRRLQGCM